MSRDQERTVEAAATAEPLEDHRNRNSQPNIIEARALRKSFAGTQALRDVHVSIAPGSITGIVGPNGSGKTTLLKCISGLLRPDSGVVCIAGVELEGRRLTPAAAAKLGLAQTFQRVALADDMTVAENILVALEAGRATFPRYLLGEVLGWRRHVNVADLQRVAELLEGTALEDAADRLVGELPLGTRRRVELARAFASRPRVVLLDEPASGLDGRESITMAGTIERLARGTDTTVVMVEHDMSVIGRVCTYLYVLEFGSLIASGPVEETLRDEHVRRAYLGHMGVGV